VFWSHEDVRGTRYATEADWYEAIASSGIGEVEVASVERSSGRTKRKAP